MRKQPYRNTVSDEYVDAQLKRIRADIERELGDHPSMRKIDLMMLQLSNGLLAFIAFLTLVIIANGTIPWYAGCVIIAALALACWANTHDHKLKFPR